MIKPQFKGPSFECVFCVYCHLVASSCQLVPTRTALRIFLISGKETTKRGGRKSRRRQQRKGGKEKNAGKSMRHLRDIRRGVMDRRTDGRTGGRTDGPSYRDAMTHLKRETDTEIEGRTIANEERKQEDEGRQAPFVRNSEYNT